MIHPSPGFRSITHDGLRLRDIRILVPRVNTTYGTRPGEALMNRLPFERIRNSLAAGNPLWDLPQHLGWPYTPTWPLYVAYGVVVGLAISTRRGA